MPPETRRSSLLALPHGAARCSSHNSDSTVDVSEVGELLRNTWHVRVKPCMRTSTSSADVSARFTTRQGAPTGAVSRDKLSVTYLEFRVLKLCMQTSTSSTDISTGVTRPPGGTHRDVHAICTVSRDELSVTYLKFHVLQTLTHLDPGRRAARRVISTRSTPSSRGPEAARTHL